MKKRALGLSFAALLFSVSALLGAQSPNDAAGQLNCPMHEQHRKASHQAVVQEHGDKAMGFPHDKTTHHFRLADDGGAIEVAANDPGDSVNTGANRSHLMRIASMFRDGDFSVPTSVHDSLPPGVTTMKLLKGKIRFAYEPINGGGRVRIESSDPVALAAIHDFLRFQITEHQTGDPLVVGQAH